MGAGQGRAHQGEQEEGAQLHVGDLDAWAGQSDQQTGKTARKENSTSVLQSLNWKKWGLVGSCALLRVLIYLLASGHSPISSC